ncbi:MAG: hypothetical protein NC218_04875 [Acetobacter sp.]|nr:hypothetical protein [Acetobacter sp.]
MVKIFNKPVSDNAFGSDTQKMLFRIYIKAHPEECPNILRVIKARLTLKDNDSAYAGDLCTILEYILQQTDEYCSEILEILQIIYAKYQRTPLTLLINIAHNDNTYAPQAFELLIQWLKVNCWSAGKLVNLYQLLSKMLEHHPEFFEDIFRVASYAILRLENDSYCKIEAEKLFNDLTLQHPELSEKIKNLLSID